MPKKIGIVYLWMILSIVFMSSFAMAIEWHASPNGTSGNSGADANHPWDLQTALSGGNGHVHAGDTIWLHGGTYHGYYKSTLNGQSGNNIVVRQALGERAVIDEGNAAQNPVLLIEGSYVTYWGFEMLSSDVPRVSSQATSFPDSEIRRGECITNNQDMTTTGNKFINLILHDCFNGIGIWKTASAEFYGLLIYNNGWEGPDRNHGHNFYGQNQAGMTRDVEGSILWGAFENEVQFYGSSAAPIQDVQFSNDILMNAPGKTEGYYFLFGGGQLLTGLTLTNNYIYDTTDMLMLNIGYCEYGNGVNGATITGNYLMGGRNCFRTPISNMAMTGNTIWAPHGNTLSSGSSDTTFDTSTYPNNNWLSSQPTGTKIVVIPNKYESKRANVAIYNWNNNPTVTINLTGVLSNGDSYNVYNAEDWPTVVAHGTYNGAVTIPMTGLTTAQPIGDSGQTRSSTGPTFGAFIVIGPSGANPPTCTDTCSSQGLSCGQQTICGSSTNCGICSSGQTCSSGHCTSAFVCTSGQCNGLTQSCNNGQWVNCAAGQNCINGFCTTVTSCTAGQKCYNTTSVGFQYANCQWTNISLCSGSCSNGQCSNVPPVCTDTCSSKGYNCGVQNICGAATNCGNCQTGQSCSSGQCVNNNQNGMFNIGDRVRVVQSTDCLNARTGPSLSSNILFCHPAGDVGTVIGGPISADNYNFWNINYDSNADGWSADKYLEKIGSTQLNNTCTDTCSSNGFNCGQQTICGTSTNCGSCTTGQSCIAGVCQTINNPTENTCVRVSQSALDVLNVRSSPGIPSDSSLNYIGKENVGNTGVLISTTPVPSQFADNNQWLNVNYDDGLVGWSAQKYLETIPCSTNPNCGSNICSGGETCINGQCVNTGTGGKLALGDRVQVTTTTDCLNARTGPTLSSSILLCHPAGDSGTVTGGPVSADGYTFWYIAYDKSPSGWSADKYLEVIGTTPINNTCTDTCSSSGYQCGFQPICGTNVNCGTCQNGQTCSFDGKCADNQTVINPGCTDSDGGINYNTFGKVVSSRDGNSYCVNNDKCTSATTLREYYCSNGIANFADVTCTSTCNSGRCNTGNNSCTDTCSSKGYACGIQSICGSNINCGSCQTGQSCNANGQCAINPPPMSVCQPGTLQGQCLVCNSQGTAYGINASKCPGGTTCSSSSGQCIYDRICNNGDIQPNKQCNVCNQLGDAYIPDDTRCNANQQCANDGFCANNTIIIPTGNIIVGSRVRVILSTDCVNARDAPTISSNALYCHPAGDLGNVTSGPVSADGLKFWNVNYDTNADGWSADKYLEAIGGSPINNTCTHTCSSDGFTCGQHNICGTNVNCGSCLAAQTCTAAGTCTNNPPTCTDTCSSKGFACGTQTVCGTSTNCGSCNNGQTCSSGVCINSAPTRSNGAPTGNLAAGTTSATLSVNTNVAATCKYSTSPNTAYASMTGTFTTTGGTTHTKSITGLANGQSYSYYVRCIVGSTSNTDDYTISFSVSSSNGGGGPAGVKFRKAILLHHSVGAYIYQGVPSAVSSFNSQHALSGSNAVQIDEQYFPGPEALNINQWYRWDDIFNHNDQYGVTMDNMYTQYPVIIVKTCYISQQTMSSASDITAYENSIRDIVSAMALKPNNYFVIWTNYPGATDGMPSQSDRVGWSYTFSTWMKNTLATNNDATYKQKYGNFPSNVYVFDVYNLLATDSHNTMGTQVGGVDASYAIGGGDDHPSQKAINLVAPVLVQQTFTNAMAYER